MNEIETRVDDAIKVIKDLEEEYRDLILEFDGVVAHKQGLKKELQKALDLVEELIKENQELRTEIRKKDE